MNCYFINPSIKIKKCLYILLILFLICCKREKSKNKSIKQKPQLNVVHKYAPIKPIESSAKKEIMSWREYKSLDSILNKFHSISADEALDNALELSNLIKLLKNNINLKNLMTPAFKVRINVLENEILRLEDMTYISAITANEVNFEVKKILDAYSATNSKINAIYSQIELDKEINIIDLDSLNTNYKKGKKLLIDDINKY